LSTRRRSAGRLFHICGPATANDLSGEGRKGKEGKESMEREGRKGAGVFHHFLFFTI